MSTQPSSSSRLSEIVDHHRREAAKDNRSLDELLARAVALPAPRSFVDALKGPQLAVIAEVKRRSPSAGALAPDLDAGTLASAYAQGGAAAISVLTDEAYFGGSESDLRAVRREVSTPVLRKDFTVCHHDVMDARLMGADAVLLIVAALNDSELKSLFDLASEVGLSALVEVHDAAELERAMVLEPKVVGVNQRNLRTFEVDTELALSLRSSIPAGVLAVAESGVATVDDARALADGGFDAILVGSSLVTSDAPQSLVRSFAALVVNSCS